MTFSRLGRASGGRGGHRTSRQRVKTMCRALKCPEGGPSKQGMLFIARRQIVSVCLCLCVCCLCVHKKGGIFSPHHAPQCRLSFADSPPFPSASAPPAMRLWTLWAGLQRLASRWSETLRPMRCRRRHLLPRAWPLCGRAFLLGRMRGCAQSKGLGFGSGFGFHLSLQTLPFSASILISC